MNFLQNLLECIQHDPLEPFALLDPAVPSQLQFSVKPPNLLFQRPKAKTKNTNKILYNWNKIEERKYINFLVKNRPLFDLSNEQRKCAKINVTMGQAICSRTAAQCHSHHQKMMLKYGSIEEIIKAHVHLIKRHTVPKRMREFVSSISNSNQSSPAASQEKRAGPDLDEENSNPAWMKYMDIWSNSKQDFSCEVGLDYLQFL